jgi:hypothetical protein
MECKKFYMVYVEGEAPRMFKYESRAQAEKEAERLSKELGAEVLILEAVASVGINSIANSFDVACEYLGRDTLFNNKSKCYGAAVAFFKLATIAEAWNKADGFTPGYANQNQNGYYPVFACCGADAGLAYARSSYFPSLTYTTVSSRLCFKTYERAHQFGTQFIDLWTEFLLIK